MPTPHASWAEIAAVPVLPSTSIRGALILIWQPGSFCLYYVLDYQDALGSQPIRIAAKSVEPEEATWDARRR